MARNQEIVQQASPIMFSDGTAGRGWGSSQSSYASPGYRVPVATQQDDGVNARLSTAALYELLRKKAEEEAALTQSPVRYVNDTPARQNALVFQDVLTGKDLTKGNKLNSKGEVYAVNDQPEIPYAEGGFKLQTSVPNEAYNSLVKSNLKMYTDELNNMMGRTEETPQTRGATAAAMTRTGEAITAQQRAAAAYAKEPTEENKAALDSANANLDVEYSLMEGFKGAQDAIEKARGKSSAATSVAAAPKQVPADVKLRAAAMVKAGDRTGAIALLSQYK